MPAGAGLVCKRWGSAQNRTAGALQAMEADGVRKDQQLLDMLIRALGAGGLVDEAHAVFRTMVRPATAVASHMAGVACTSLAGEEFDVKRIKSKAVTRVSNEGMFARPCCGQPSLIVSRKAPAALLILFFDITCAPELQNMPSSHCGRRPPYAWLAARLIIPWCASSVAGFEPRTPCLAKAKCHGAMRLPHEPGSYAHCARSTWRRCGARARSGP